MRLVLHTTLIDSGNFSKTQEYANIITKIEESIKKVVWPIGSKKFTIYPEKGKETGKGNGVKPIKDAFINNLVKEGWEPEKKLDIATVVRPGPVDITYQIGDKYFAVEWETGNISSSHRALNKMTIGIMNDILIGGILIVPTRNLYEFLTDRVGNYRELEPYFQLWQSISCDNGYLGIIAIEYDDTSWDVPKIPKGTDGRAKV